MENSELIQEKFWKNMGKIFELILVKCKRNKNFGIFKYLEKFSENFNEIEEKF